MGKPNKAFWIWGEFSKRDAELLNQIQEKVQSKLCSPRFKIHMTLAGPFDQIEENEIKSIKSFCKARSPIQITPQGYNYKEEFFKSIFIDIKQCPKLENLRGSIFKLNHRDSTEDFFPHISLAYGNHKEEVKINVISFLPKLFNAITLNRISIVEIVEDIDLWRIVDSFCFNPKL